MQKRVVANPEYTAASRDSLPFASQMPSTLVQPDLRSKVSTALFNMAEQEPPVLFATRFQLLSDQCEGSQAVVQFAREARGSLKQFAIKCACLMHQHALFVTCAHCCSRCASSLQM